MSKLYVPVPLLRHEANALPIWKAGAAMFVESEHIPANTFFAFKTFKVIIGTQIKSRESRCV